MAASEMSVRCCIAGGGPAGIMLGLLLARAGVGVLVLEKHADFLRDFRGDTIHPSTLEGIYELGLLEDLLKLPHQKAARLNGQVDGLALTVRTEKGRCLIMNHKRRIHDAIVELVVTAGVGARVLRGPL